MPTDGKQGLALLKASADDGFDALTALLRQALDADMALLCIFDADADLVYLKGISDASPGADPVLSRVLCALVRDSGRQLAIENTGADPGMRDLAVLRGLGIGACLAAPVLGAEGEVIAAICAISHAPRHWSERDKQNVASLTACVTDQIRLREAMLQQESARREAEKIADMRVQFLARMSHEIRTPMNGVIGMAEALFPQMNDPVKRRMVGVIRDSGDHLMSVLNDILDLSKIEAGGMELAATPFRPADLATQVADLHGPVATAKRVELVMELPPDGLRARMGDAHRIRQVLHNLVGNALKFTPAGRVTVRFSDDGPLSIEVEDSGIGMTEEEISTVFDPYRQAGVGTAGRFGGTGLGLPIVQRLVRIMGGDLTCRSAFGSGSVFRIVLPLPLAPAPAKTDRSATDPPAQALPRGLRVLLVDDNATNRFVLETLLRRVGAVPTVCSDGSEALSAYAEGAFDLLMLDIEMPGLRGDGVLGAIRQRDSAAPPALAVTANVMPTQIRSYLAAGFGGHLPKPLTLDGMAEAIHAALNDDVPQQAEDRLALARLALQRGSKDLST